MDIDSTVEPDLITSLGYLCLGSRLKRLGERMQAGVAQVLGELGYSVQPAQLPILMALYLNGAMTIGLLGERVGISQPGVSRAISALAGQGLVRTLSAGADKRHRRIELTDPGRAQMAVLARRLFPVVEREVARVCAATGSDFLGQIATIEAELADQPLDQRISRGLEGDDHG